MRNRLREQEAFTLIELMIVVAIIGILAAIAVPQYLRWQVQSRQAEAKTNLGGIFAAELSYYGANSRFGSFGEVGFALAAASNRYTYRSPGDGGNSGASCGGATTSSCILSGIGTSAADGQGTAGLVAMGSLSPPGFTATAAGNLDTDATVDQWHVNDLKQGLAAADQDDVAF
ncbi:MAG: prepilin-type N-terminal cleavage/methylation domain-containing protein [Nitrospirota bacterium]